MPFLTRIYDNLILQYTKFRALIQQKTHFPCKLHAYNSLIYNSLNLKKNYLKTVPYL